MSEIQMVVTTASGTVEGVWEEAPDGTTAEEAAKGLSATLKDPDDSLGLFTDDGIVVVPHHAIDHVRIRVRP